MEKNKQYGEISVMGSVYHYDTDEISDGVTIHMYVSNNNNIVCRVTGVDDMIGGIEITANDMVITGCVCDRYGDGDTVVIVDQIGVDDIMVDGDNVAKYWGRLHDYCMLMHDFEEGFGEWCDCYAHNEHVVRRHGHAICDNDLPSFFYNN